MKTIIANVKANVLAVIKMREDERQASGMSAQGIASAYMRENYPELIEWTKSEICEYDMDIDMCVWTITIYANSVVTFKEEEY